MSSWRHAGALLHDAISPGQMVLGSHCPKAVGPRVAGGNVTAGAPAVVGDPDVGTRDGAEVDAVGASERGAGVGTVDGAVGAGDTGADVGEVGAVEATVAQTVNPRNRMVWSDCQASTSPGWATTPLGPTCPQKVRVPIEKTSN